MKVGLIMFSVRNIATYFFILCSFLLLFNPLNTAVKAASFSNSQLIFIVVNDELIAFSDDHPFVLEGLTYVPLRSLSTILGADVMYDQNEHAVRVHKDGQVLTIHVFENTYESEGMERKFLPIKMVDNRTYVPLRLVAEFFQLQVDFYEDIPLVRLIERYNDLQYSYEELLSQYKEKIEIEKQKWQVNKTLEKKGKTAYLTFDDGPTASTSQILDILQNYHVQATFFMIEPKIWNYQEEVKRMIAENHAIGSHSVTHQKNIVYKNPKSLLEEMQKTRDTLYTITGVDSRLIRVPYGSKPYLTAPFRNVLAEHHFQVWDWNVDSNDWRFTKEEILNTVKKQVKKLNEKNITPVILFHDRKETAEILPAIIEFLQAEGYELKAHDSEQHFMVNFWNDERL